MSNEPPIGDSEDELERRIAALESEEWLGALKGLKPVQSVDLYAIGFEAGKQAILVSNQSMKLANTGWFQLRTALISSVASVAATVLVMFALPKNADRQSISPGIAEAAEQGNLLTNEFDRAVTRTAENEAQSNNPSFDDALAEVLSIWRERLQGIAIKVPNSDDSKRVVDVEPSRLRYAFQRRQLIENLGEIIQ
jgi:hypothetical protein